LTREGWEALFVAAFKESRNPMVLLDSDRLQLEANGAYLKFLGYPRDKLLGRPVYEFVLEGPRISDQAWADLLHSERFTGEVEFVRADGSVVGAQWACTPEVVTGKVLALCVALSTSRWGPHYRREHAPEPEPSPLSKRELEVLRLVAMGSTGPEVAEELHISHDTVRTHMRNAMTKTGARSRAQLVAKALGNGHILA
jgi:PAS domain S-box-containing protein